MPHLNSILPALALLAGCDRTVPRSPEDRPELGLVTNVGFVPGAEVSTDVVDECEVQSLIVEDIAAEAWGDFTIRLLRHHEGVPLPALVVRFAKIEAEGAGIISGAKSITLEGRLVKGGIVVASFTAQRTTINGYAGGFYRGTCDLVENVLEELAEDIAQWLRHPTPGAMLGEL
jgi:hypothetical protein